MIAEAPSFALQLATAAEPGELEAWLAGAVPGVPELYASGIQLPRTRAGVVLVTRWEREGKVTTTSRRDPADRRRWQFLVVKKQLDGCARPSGRSHGTPGPSSIPPATATRQSDGRATLLEGARKAGEQAEALLRLLRDRAAAGRACPTFAETAGLLGLAKGRRGTRRAQYLFDRLAEQRRIAVAWAGPGQRRVVTILARGRGCGRSTASEVTA